MPIWATVPMRLANGYRAVEGFFPHRHVKHVKV